MLTGGTPVSILNCGLIIKKDKKTLWVMNIIRKFAGI